MTRYMIRSFVCLLVLFSLQLNLGAQGVVEKDDALLQLQRECFNNPKLHGAWIVHWNPKPLGNGTTLLELSAIVDPDREGQKEILRKLVADLKLNQEDYAPPTIETFYELPLAKLITEVQKELAEDLQDPGHLLEGVHYYYDPALDEPVDPDVPRDITSPTLRLVPYGRGKDQDQADRIGRAVGDYAINDPAWKDGWDKLKKGTDKLNLVVISTKLRPFEMTNGLLADLAVLDRFQRANGKLPIALVELAERRDHQETVFAYDAYVVVDSGSSAAQMEAAKKILQGVKGLGQLITIVQVKRAPFAELVRRLNIEFESFEKFDGCRLSTVRLFAGSVEDTYTVRMALEGQLADEGQRAELEALVNEMIAGAVQFDDIGQFAPLEAISDQMVIKPGSPLKALAAYNKAYRMFMEAVELQDEANCLDAAGKPVEANPLRQKARQNFEAANILLRAAMILAPATMEYRYWRILVLIELEQGQEASDHMRALVRRDFKQFDYVLACRSLEHIQGGRRSALNLLQCAITVDLAQ